MKTNPAELPNPMFRQLLQASTPGMVRRELGAMADEMGRDAFARWIAREAVARTRPDKAIPAIYADYRSLVRDGIEFFLSRINYQRLLDLAVDQLKMDPAAGAEARLLAMAKRFPTLHKLGQIIARHPNIDPAVKRWLVQLENGRYGTSSDALVRQVHRQLEGVKGRDRLHIRPEILSEASVGAVIPFEWDRSGDAQRVRGVFKIIKSDIREHLAEELIILGQTASFFEANRARYPLRDFKFLKVFQSLREMLIKEIDLAAEQGHLAEAARFYGDMDGVRIPRCLPIGGDGMTAMTYMEGPKITDADLNPEQRRQLAAVLFDALVCRPLFYRRDAALFHGDPHAGNILAIGSAMDAAPRIGLLDWSLAGRLAKGDRVRTVQLIQAIYKRDLDAVCSAVQALAAGASGDPPLPRPGLRAPVLALMLSDEFSHAALVRKAFRLLESLSQEGWIFPAELMLFRKAIFTLEGVLYDLWPSFDMDAAVTRYVTGLIIREIPLRIEGLFFPLADRAENYPSLISNAELHSLMVHQFAAAMEACSLTWIDTVSRWCQMANFPYGPFAGEGLTGAN